MWRIMMRNTVANCTASRQVNIDPESKELGFFLLHMIMTVMENIVASISVEPDPEKDFENSTSEMMRGMFGQLFALMASTEGILCTAFQLIYKSTNVQILPDEQWWVVSRMVRLFPYTCWNKEVLLRNVQTYVVRAARKRLAQVRFWHQAADEWLGLGQLCIL